VSITESVLGIGEGGVGDDGVTPYRTCTAGKRSLHCTWYVRRCCRCRPGLLLSWSEACPP